MVGYEFECGGCQERFTSVLDHRRDNLRRQRHTCGGLARRVYHPARHRFGFRAGWDDSVQQYFGTQAQRDTYMSENDLVVREPKV